MYEPVAAAMGVLAKYDVRERNTLRKRLECGEQARGRESAHAEWYRVLEEFCGRRDDPHARRKIRSPGGLLSAMLAESGFKAEG